eukprot:Opistho-2@52786
MCRVYLPCFYIYFASVFLFIFLQNAHFGSLFDSVVRKHQKVMHVDRGWARSLAMPVSQEATTTAATTATAETNAPTADAETKVLHIIASPTLFTRIQAGDKVMFPMTGRERRLFVTDMSHYVELVGLSEDGSPFNADADFVKQGDEYAKFVARILEKEAKRVAEMNKQKELQGTKAERTAARCARRAAAAVGAAAALATETVNVTATETVNATTTVTAETPTPSGTIAVPAAHNVLPDTIAIPSIAAFLFGNNVRASAVGTAAMGAVVEEETERDQAVMTTGSAPDAATVNAPEQAEREHGGIELSVHRGRVDCSMHTAGRAEMLGLPSTDKTALAATLVAHLSASASLSSIDSDSASNSSGEFVEPDAVEEPVSTASDEEDQLVPPMQMIANFINARIQDIQALTMRNVPVV